MHDNSKGWIAASTKLCWPPLNRGRIPSLDGLRAISITLVLIGHGSSTFPDVGGAFRWLLPIVGNGELGVTVFFVLSGFLITSLLLNEVRKTGRISIRAFYIRRAFRIWPAFYLLIAFVGLLGLFHAIPLTKGEIISSSLFFWNYYPYGSTWFLGHTWSLAVEEQFYLVWPLALRWVGSRRATWIAIGIIALEPVVRVANYFLVPSMRGYISIMGHTRADSLMIGAIAALLYDRERFRGFMERLFQWKLPLLGTAFVLFVDPFVAQKWRGTYLLPIGFSLENFCIAAVMLWTILNPRTLAGRILNSPIAVHVGYISYSLYLWQQIFMTTYNHTLSGKFPVNLAFTFAVAECSYWFVEKTFLRWRKRFTAEA